MIRLAARWAVFVLLLGFCVRCVIAAELLGDVHLQPGQVFLAILVGLLQDVWALVIVSGPLALAFLVGERTGRVALFVLVVVLLVVTIAELFFWWEFESRLNRLVFHYLLFPREVLTFLEDQFYVSIYVIPALVLAGLAYRFVRGPSVRDPLVRGEGGLPVSAFILCMAACGAVVLFVEPWEFSKSRRINQMANNGFLGVAHAATTNEGVWRGRYWSPAEPSQPPVVSPPSVARERIDLSHIKHVVLVVEESFAGDVWSDPELRSRYMPGFSALSARGVYFDRLYATGTRTTRGLEALLNGFPPLPGIAVTQRSGYERLPSLPRALSNAGFFNVFVYGGWPGFSNFFPYWRALGYEKLTSRDDFPHPRHETSWGVADEYVFSRVREEMDELTTRHERVFLTTLTISHHRPFDFPAGRIPFPAEERRSEYALAYADWALSRFLEESSGDDWFDDTLFVIAADHGPRISGDAPIPVDGFRIPLLLYSPANLEPRLVSSLGSSMSFGITLLELLGLPDTEGLYGTSLLTGAVGEVPLEHDYHVGLLTDGGLTVLHRGGDLSTWRFFEGRLVPTAVDLVVAGRAARLFGGAHAWFYDVNVPATAGR